MMLSSFITPAYPVDFVEISPVALEQDYTAVTVSTKTPWSYGASITYRGVPLVDVLRNQGQLGDHLIEVRAANGYSKTITLSEIVRRKPVLAFQARCSTQDIESVSCPADGFVPLDVKNYGPVFLIWPLREALSSDTSDDNSFWVWFVTSLHKVN